MCRLAMLALCLVALALATTASPVTPGHLAQRLRGGCESSSAGERVVHVGLPEDDEDANEPYMREDSNPSASTFSSSDDSEGRCFNADWSAARNELTQIIEEREKVTAASKGLRLRGGASAAPEAKGGMIPVSIKVTAHHIHPINSPPVKVVICGAGPELGEWDIAKGIELKSVVRATESFSGSGMFPEHQGTIMLPAGKKFEFKYAVTMEDPAAEHGGPKTQWEAVNRVMDVPLTGTLDIISEFMEARDSDPRITDEPFQCNSQQWSRYYSHHILPLPEVQPGRAG